VKHGNHWKGGKVIDQRGYVLIYVGKSHPLADCRGYAYEHRLQTNATKDELVHHDNEIKGDNSPNNLIKTTKKSHGVFHRKLTSKRRNPDEPNFLVECACKCGGTLLKYDDDNRPRKYIHGHNGTRNKIGRFTPWA